MKKRVAVACALAGAAIGISACSSAGSSASGGDASQLAGSTAGSKATCDFYTTGQADNNGQSSDVQVTTEGGQSCKSWLQSLASEGLNWSIGTDQAFDSTDPGNPNTNYNGNWAAFSQNCELSRSGAILTVFSDGDTPSSTAICSQYESSGWTPYTPTQAQAEASASAAAAQASAQASIVASQQASQNAAAAAQDLPNYISTLESDTSALTSNGSDPNTQGALTVFSGGVTTLKDDLQTVQSDYQAELSNYQSQCYNGPVSGAADSAESDAGQVSSDLQALQGDINASQNSVLNPNFTGVGVVEQDISNVNSDLAALRKVGQAPSQDPSQAIAKAEEAIQAANAAAAQALKEGNAINAQASQISNEAAQLAQTASKQPWFSNDC